MKMSRSADERRMPQSRSRPARRREGGAWLGFAIALWAPKVGAAPHRPLSHCVTRPTLYCVPTPSRQSLTAKNCRFYVTLS